MWRNSDTAAIDTTKPNDLSDFEADLWREAERLPPDMFASWVEDFLFYRGHQWNTV
jgi:hypothetical protein